MSAEQSRKFARSLTKSERTYLWEHVYRYAGVEGVSAKEQFQQLVMYVLNFLGGDSTIEKKIFAKAMKMFE